jgi:formylglycine-generating enzyme required for sulfatase activity
VRFEKVLAAAKGVFRLRETESEVCVMDLRKCTLGTFLFTMILSVDAELVLAVEIIDGPTTNPANGHVYYLLSLSTWPDAEAEAVKLGGHLATINDEEENAWVYNSFANHGGIERGLWIGLNDLEEEGAYVWICGDDCAYRNWGATEPNDNDRGEDYVGILWPSEARAPGWADFPLCDQWGDIPICGVVELDVTATQMAFRRGDSDTNGVLNLTDAIYTLNFLFLGGPTPACLDAVDADDNGQLNLTDAVYTLNHLFLGGSPPPDPGPVECGSDPTNDGLLCLSYAPCRPKPPIEIEGFTFIGDNEQGYREYTHDQTGIVFVLLPGGKFNMGSPADEPWRDGDEGPVHEVTLSPFLTAKYEVTQGQWKQVMGSNPSGFQGANVPAGVNSDQLPVETVSWDDIQQFEAKTGLGLPTEAQWEYAARAGTATAFSFGSGESCADWMGATCAERDPFMWYCGNSEGRTHEVGTKAANAFGLHDMHGGVFEWCADIYDLAFYAKPEAAGPDPACTSGSERRVFRGGGWDVYAGTCRSADRGGSVPWPRDSTLGFRPAFRRLP